MATSTTRERRYTVGSLVIDLYDPESKQLAWRGAITATVSDNPKSNEKKIRKGVAKIFKDFPPTPKP